MDPHAQVALIRQEFDRLCALREPEKAQDWQPTEEQRLVYAKLVGNILNRIDDYRSAEKRQLLREAHVQVDVSDSAFVFFHEQLEPRIPALKEAHAVIDPGGAELYGLLEGIGLPGGANGRVKATFDEAIQQIYNLIDRNPDQDFGFLPDTAYEVLDSKLIAFEPDSWLDREGKRREKKLEHLIEDIGGYLQPLKEPMNKLRTYGNEYLHPKSSKFGNESLFQREKAAKDALETVISVTESLYRAAKRNA